ncbi:hypothetical protein [Microvirga vignae]|nr:hypothetical protein [Microvirga vignae]
MDAIVDAPSSDALKGLPKLAGDDLALLTGRGEVVVARKNLVCSYRPGKGGYEPGPEIECPALVTALADSVQGTLVAAGGMVFIAASDGVRKVVDVDGVVRSVMAVGQTVFAVAGRPGRVDGKLFEIDPLRGAILSERSLSSHASRLTADPTGSFLTIADGTMVRTLSLRQGDPCPDDRSSEPSKTSEHPASESRCDCRKEEGEQESGTSVNTVQNQPAPPAEPCDLGTSGLPTPDGGRIIGRGNGVTRHPPGSRRWDPCQTHLFFEPYDIKNVGPFLVASDREARHVAVLAGDDLRLLHQAHFRDGAVILSHRSQPMMLAYTRSESAWKHTVFTELDHEALETEPALNPDIFADTMTWTGTPLPVLKGGRAPAVGNRKALIIPVLDPGQNFNDPDLGKLAQYMNRACFKHVQDFYTENSFNQLTIQFDIHGVHHGKGGPVPLPKPIADYFFPLYVGAHVDLIKSGLTFPATLVFDGRERMTMTIQPLTGGRPSSTINVRLSALLASGLHATYPAEVKFLGAETAAISLKLPNGTSATLNLKFTPTTITINDAGQIAGASATLSTYLDGVIAAAANTAGIPNPFAKPDIRFVVQDSKGPGFLVTRFFNAVSSGPKLEVLSVTYSGAKDPLGLNSAYKGRMVIPATDGSTLKGYLDYVTVLAQEEAGLTYLERRLHTDPSIVIDAAAGKLTSSLFIAQEDGGPGAAIKLSNVSGMDALFDTSNEVANTEVTPGRSLTPKDGAEGFDGLVDHVFTAMVDRLGTTDPQKITEFFKDYGAILFGIVHPAQSDPKDPDFVQPAEWWTAGPTSWKSEFRPTEAPRGARYLPRPKEIQLQSNWALAPMAVKPDYFMFCHEFGHAIGFNDLYKREATYRDDLIYMDKWAMMDNHTAGSHHCAYHKWQAGWIRDEGTRIHRVPRPPEGQTQTHEVLLAPVEHWPDNNTLVSAAQTVFGNPNLPVAQLVWLEPSFGADLFNFIEARQKGIQFSTSLPQDPAVLVTNCIVFWEDNRYAFEGKYRAPVHLLHKSNQLLKAGDSFNLALSEELPTKGVVVSVIARKTVAGVEVFHLKIERTTSHDFIDLFFPSADPYYKSPDVWVDWTGDNGPDGKTSSTDRKDARRFPEGQPVNQGEKIRVPDSGEEWHWIGARLRNRGNVHAEKVKVNFSICEPPGAGDRGNFVIKWTETLPRVDPTGTNPNPDPVLGKWMVPAGFSGHSCVLVEVADLQVPRDHTGAALASQEEFTANNKAQKNVDDIGPKGSSPFDPVDFEFSLNNSARWPEVAYLEPEGLPYGMTLTVSPRRRRIAAGETAIFRCRLEVDDKIIASSCHGDNTFRINAWRVDQDSSVRWGGVEYRVRPRKRSTTDFAGSWDWHSLVEINGHVDPSNIAGSVRIRLAYANHHAKWVSVDLKPGATFSYKEKAPADTRELYAMVLFEGNKYYSESRSPERRIIPPPPIR